MTQATVNIIDVVEGAIEVYADALTAKDSLFDAMGGTHPIKKTEDRTPKSGRYIKVTRHDGWVDYFEPDDVIAIMPAEGTEGRALDRESSGSRQGYIETGRYSTVDEEREINPGSHHA